MVQGRTDVPLSDHGVEEVNSWHIPAEFMDYQWVASPLKRALETAGLLSQKEPSTDDRLMEMEWGEWEGQRLADLRAELGDLMVAWEAKGLDFRAPGGESPRDVQARTKPFLQDIAKRGQPTVAVTHKGVIRALYSAATGWDMTSKEPERIEDGCWHSFRLAEDGLLSTEKLNMDMTGTK